MKKIICLDLDDTLIQTQEAYFSINNNILKVITEETSFPVNDISNYQLNLDINMIETMGFSPERYPLSWVKTYHNFSLEKKSYVEKQIYSEAKQIFSKKIELHNDAHKFLNNLKENDVEVWIVTHGDYNVQNKRMDDIHLDWVTKKIISDHKNYELYKSIKKNYSAELYMIGNSIPHDIEPARQAGFKAIHINRNFSWKYDQYSKLSDFPSCKTLGDIWDLLKMEV
ncbi:HAD family hydrolase [Cytobacillus horneckiae]|uniref:HAD family hydrolase n=1 Tax=Cytobacillus horneckiae TaxID=549687 RepID=UPI0039A01065